MTKEVINTPTNNTSQMNIIKILSYTTALGVWLVVFWNDFPHLFNLWNNDNYSHCYIIPLVIGYLVWTNRQRLIKSSGGTPLLGYLVCFFAASLFILGRLGSLNTFVYLSMWLSLCGGALVAFGHRSFKAFGVPFLIGLFMIPLPPFVDKLTSLNLRLISSVFAEKMLQIVQVPVYREGNLIDLGVIQLQVVDACSGLRYLWPALLMAILVGWFYLSKKWKRGILLFCVIPVTILANSFRIALTGVLTKFIDPSLAEGFFHDFSGWLVYIFSLGGLGICAYLLRRNDPLPEQSKSTDKADSLGWIRVNHWIHGFAVAVIVAGMSLGTFFLLENHRDPERLAFSSFPTRIGNWEGQLDKLSAPVLDSLGTDDYLNGTFRNSETGDIIHVLVSWYDRQTTRHAAHAPTSCLVGGGWDVESKQVLSTNGPRSFPVTQMVLLKNKQPLISNFWFLQRGRVVTSEWLNKWFLLLDSIVTQRTDGALVRMEMPVRKGQSVSDAQSEMNKFATELRSTLIPYLPADY